MAWRERAGLAGVVGIASLAFLSIVALVGMAVSRKEPPTFVPTQRPPYAGIDALHGPDLFTADATAPDRWRFFSFASGTLVERPGALDWDIAFRRFQVMTNGGPGFHGRGGLLDLGEVRFEDVLEVPVDGYVANTVRGDTVNAAGREWYSYSYLSHLLSPRPRVFALRTADGRYAKMQFVGYYCPGAVAGCVTFRYVFQGDGSPRFEAP